MIEAALMSQKSARRPRAQHPDTPAFDPLDQANPLPLYAQVQERLRAALEHGLRTGQYRPGDFFTTEKDLCRQFRISAITAKRALDEMEAEGALVRQRGRGTYVAQPRFPQVLDHFYRFTTYMREHGFNPSSQTLAVRTRHPDAHVAAALGLKRNEVVVEIDRLRSVNGEPFFLQTSSLPLRLFPGLDKLDHDQQSLYEILSSHYHLPPTHCTDTFEPVLLRKHEMQRLQTPARIPGMLLERIAYSSDTPVEFSRGVIRGDRCRLTVDLR
jgi:GntR family transcriptional regulator